MKNKVPINKVNHNYTDVLDKFVKALVEKQTDNIKAIILTGSYARGEATDSSDLDVWCLFKHINTDVLSSVGEVARVLPVRYDDLEVNAQCLTTDEFESGHFLNFISPIIIRFEAVLLYGDFSLNEIPSSEIEYTYKKIMAEVLLSIRHYISVDEPKENLSYQKLNAFILKPLMFALRLEHYLKTGNYPLSTKELQSACDSHNKILVLWFMHPGLLDEDIRKDHHHVLNTMHNLIQDLLELFSPLDFL
jgi:predicted nucleotidyltransferase